MEIVLSLYGFNDRPQGSHSGSRTFFLNLDEKAQGDYG
jgi:hypothetical protein